MPSSTAFVFIVVFVNIIFDISNAFLTYRIPIQRTTFFNANIKMRLEVMTMSLSSLTSTTTSPNNVSPRVQRIKDLSTQRQILNDLTACEFALRVELKTDEKKIDYDKLIFRLDNDLEIIRDRPNIRDAEVIRDRIVQTKQDLLQLQQGLQPRNMSYVAPVSSTLVEDSKAFSARVDEWRKNLRILVREDGTVDWDGAVASSKEVAKFGAELWERLNGKEEGIPSIAEILGQVQAKQPRTPVLDALEVQLNEAKATLQGSVDQLEALKDRVRQARRDSTSSRVVESDLKNLLQLETIVREQQRWVSIRNMDFDLERIFLYLEGEIEASADPKEQRIFVAEVALIEKQFSTILNTLKLSGGVINRDLISIVDDDELMIINSAITDLKTRLGIDTQSVFDWGSLGVFVTESLAKLKTGLSFYGDGVKLLVRDLRYAFLLLVKALQGTTLKPREVNAIRRTGKDLLTLIPFTIILIVPLTPVGHVLAFALLQKYFPDFYPSFFTEKRQNLKKLFAEIESREGDEIDAILGSEGAPTIDFGAITEVTADTLRSLAASLTSLLTKSSQKQQ